MAQGKKYTKAEVQRIIRILRKHKGNRSAAMEEVGIGAGPFYHVLALAEKFKIPVPAAGDPTSQRRESQLVPDERLHAAWDLYERHNYNAAAAAEASGHPPSTFTNHIQEAIRRFGYEKKRLGTANAQQPIKLGLPIKNDVHVFILTCAQNDTAIHRPTWEALLQMAKYRNAEIKVSTFTYVITQEGSQKRGREKKATAVKKRWWAKEVEPYISDDFEQLAPGLVWCGNMNTLPTAVSPLTGWESFTGRASGIFPHPKFAMESIATSKGDGTKFNYTTGCVTLRNYIQKRAGIRADFHHSYGALLVEVDSDGHWFCRQLNADDKGNIYDLDVVATPEGVFESDQCEAIVWGDIHVANIEPWVKALAWEPNGMLDALNPKAQVFHDILDFQSRSHHNRKDPHEMFRLWVTGQDSVLEEIRGVSDFINYSSRSSTLSLVVNSNHDNHLERWLKEADWRDDLPNAEFYIEAQSAMLKAIRSGVPFNGLKWALGRFELPKNLRMLNQDESYIVCKSRGDGIELGMHGDLGPNGSRGNARNLARLGRKACIGHSHACGIYEGVYVAGVTGKLDQGYNVGPSNWSHSHIVIYPNGKRAIVTMWKGKWRAT